VPKPKDEISREKIRRPLQVEQRGVALRKTYTLDCGVDDVHPLARAKGGGGAL